MDLDLFIEKIRNEIEDVNPDELTADKDYRELEQWSSMYALILIAMIDTDYGVTLTGEDMRSAKTVRQLYQIVKDRK